MVGMKKKAKTYEICFGGYDSEPEITEVMGWSDNPEDALELVISLCTRHTLQYYGIREEGKQKVSWWRNTGIQAVEEEERKKK